MATWKSLLLQDSASPNMENLLYFHDHTVMIMLMITILVASMMATMMKNKFTHRFLLHGQTIETVWTILPACILIIIAVPSLRILYTMDEINNPSFTVKAIGHQWYWSYEYSDFGHLEFDSYMIPINSMKPFNFRLLDVDNRMVLPFSTHLRLMVTSADVIHSWAVPSLGAKIDGTPGRLNQISLFINRTGLFYGQCSEICGANHSFMPIVVESISPAYFYKWINSDH